MGEPHAELVRAAAAWLRGSRRCRVVATEFSSMTSETPDAIGFGTRDSVVVECKVSRADFFRNAQKGHERSERSVGDERWFLTPEGLVKPHEVPEGWGLLELHRYSTGKTGFFLRRIVSAPERERKLGSVLAERVILVSIASRALQALDLVRPLSLGDLEQPEDEGEG
jgi:hypothetical protein